jgi:hypothetical protein
MLNFSIGKHWLNELLIDFGENKMASDYLSVSIGSNDSDFKFV